MKLLLSVMAISSFMGMCNAQSPTTFQKAFGGVANDYGRCALQTSDGGFVIIGETMNFGAGNLDVYLLKTDSSGILIWTKTFGGSEDDYSYSIQETNDGGFIIAGVTSSYGAGNADVYLLKTDSIGNLIWSKAFGGTDFDYGYSVEQTNDGGFIVAGYTASFGAGFDDIYLIKTAFDGTLEWANTYGGVNVENGYSVQQTNDGGFVIAGSTVSFGAGINDVYIVKTASDGTLQWTKTFGGPVNDQADCIRQTDDHGFIIAGSTSSFGEGNSDIYIIKTDSTGSLIWSKTYGGSNFDYCSSIYQTLDGGFAIGGYTSSFDTIFNADGYLMKIMFNGNIQWAKTYGGTDNEYGGFVRPTSDMGYFYIGWGWSFGAGNSDVYLVKTDSIGRSGCNYASVFPNIDSGGVESTGGIQNAGIITNNPTTQTGSGGSEITICSISSLDENNLLNNVSLVYPNPFSYQTTLVINNVLNNATIIIYNHLGQEVKQIKNIFGQTITLFLENLAAGVYFINIAEGDKTLGINKLIIVEQ